MASKENKKFRVVKIIRILPAILCMFLIFYLSNNPTSQLSNDVKSNFFMYKTLHIIEYAILAFLLFIYFLNYKYTIISAYLYAMFDEVHQTYIVGREGRFRDTIIDLIGILIAIFLIKKINKHIIKFLNKLNLLDN